MSICDESWGNGCLLWLLIYGITECLAGASSLAYGAAGPTGWSFKNMKAWNSTLVYLAKTILPVNNLIFCFNIQFFLSTYNLFAYRL